MPLTHSHKSIPEIVNALRTRWARLISPRHSATSVSHRDAWGWFEAKRPAYDRLVTAAAPFVDKNGVIFDIGANIGYFTHLLCVKTQFTGRAYLFEPLPHLADLCTETLKTSSCKPVIKVLGLSDVSSTEDLWVAADGNIGWNTLVTQKASDDMVRVAVTIKAFPDCGVDEVPCFIKIDVEGLEYKVLRGMLPQLRAWATKPVILCEVGWGQSHPAWSDELAVFNELKHMGYKVSNLDGESIDLETLSRTTDILFIPTET